MRIRVVRVQSPITDADRTCHSLSICTRRRCSLSIATVATLFPFTFQLVNTTTQQPVVQLQTLSEQDLAKWTELISATQSRLGEVSACDDELLMPDSSLSSSSSSSLTSSTSALEPPRAKLSMLRVRISSER